MRQHELPLRPRCICKTAKCSGTRTLPRCHRCGVEAAMQRHAERCRQRDDRLGLGQRVTRVKE